MDGSRAAATKLQTHEWRILRNSFPPVERMTYLIMSTTINHYDVQAGITKTERASKYDNATDTLSLTQPNNVNET